MRSWLLYITPLALFTGVFAWIHGELVLACTEWAVFVTSVLYWSDYTNRRRRLLDIVTVQVCLWTHILRCIQNVQHDQMRVLAAYAAAAIAYSISVQLNTFVVHALVWMFGAIGNILLVCACR